MACPAVTTGNVFLVRALEHIDCQAQTLGSLGFQALAAPGSMAAILMTSLLALFVAIYGIRLLLGPAESPRDLTTAVLKVGIVLTIATSWPAWRTVAYASVLYGPAEVAASIMPSTLPSPRAAFAERLQALDTGIAVLTRAGTGRQTGEVIDQGAASGFRSIALTDEAGLGWSRPIFLGTTIGALGLVRLSGGLLLALAPLLAGLLLFDFSRGLFVGWLRGLTFVALGSLGLTVALSLELAVLEPWLADALNKRILGYATPTAPTELLGTVGAFAILIAGLLWVLARVSFHSSWFVHLPALPFLTPATGRERGSSRIYGGAEMPVHSRAIAISEGVSSMMRRETLYAEGIERVQRLGFQGPLEAIPATPALTSNHEPLGSGYRRSARRETHSQRRRDERG